MDDIELQHHGVKGQKWGVRRYQNKDGTLTPAGKKRRTVKEVASDTAKKVKNKAKKVMTKERAAKIVTKGAEATAKVLQASLMDDIFYDGMGKKVLKETVKQTGRAAVTAYTMARGGYDIRWYDN